MRPEEMFRFNVFSTYEPRDETPNRFWLEAFNGHHWEAVTYEGNRLDYQNLNQVAQRIVQLAPQGADFKRVITESRSQDSSDGTLAGIVLRKSGVKLVRALSVDELKDLAREIDNLYLANPITA